MISAIVLTAGKSERMGRPKALLSFRGKTFLEAILDSIRLAGITDTVVVLGHHRNEILRAVRLEKHVFNPDYEKGMVTSLQAGIRALSSETAGALVFLVDHPDVEPAVIRSLTAASGDLPIVIPTFQGRRGHPVLFFRPVLDEILALPPEVGANMIVRRDASRVLEVPVKSSGVLLDVDTPEQYEGLSHDQP